MPPAVPLTNQNRIETERASRFWQSVMNKRRAALGTATAIALQVDPLPPLPERQAPVQEPTASTETQEQEEEQAGRQQMMQATLLQNQQQAMIARERRVQQDQAQQKVRQEVKRKVKQTAQKAVTRGIRWVLQGIMGVIDIGTVGVGLIVTILFQLIDLAWTNVEMVYGSWIAKGKSKFVMPLDWTPIPMPLPVIWLHVLVIFLDILVFGILTALFLFGMISLFMVGTLLLLPVAPTVAIPITLSNFGPFLNIIRSIVGI